MNMSASFLTSSEYLRTGTLFIPRVPVKSSIIEILNENPKIIFLLLKGSLHSLKITYSPEIQEELHDVWLPKDRQKRNEMKELAERLDLFLQNNYVILFKIREYEHFNTRETDQRKCRLITYKVSVLRSKTEINNGNLQSFFNAYKKSPGNVKNLCVPIRNFTFFLIPTENAWTPEQLNLIRQQASIEKVTGEPPGLPENRVESEETTNEQISEPVSDCCCTLQ